MININEKIQHLINACGATVLSGVEAIDLGLIRHENELAAFGLYLRSVDVIIINSKSETAGISDYVTLHELIHWSGRCGRSERSYMLSDESKPHVVFVNKYLDDQTEEVTAMRGMYYLAVALGLDESIAYGLHGEYVDKARWANIEQAEIDAKLAVQYLLSFVQQIRVA